jgi:hypothetical protein
MNSEKSTPRLKHGEEPTGLLLSVMSAQLETLIDRGVVQVLTANTPDGAPCVVLVIANTQWTNKVLVLATPESVGKSVGSVGNEAANTPESVGN